MKIIETSIKDLYVIEPVVFDDDRGYFFESFHVEKLKECCPDPFVQDNQSMSGKGVLRGLHYQVDPYAQGKLVRVLAGAVIDVAVDIRPDSPTYGQHETFELSGTNFRMAYIPPGFAHGFVTMEDNTVFSYKCTNFYHKESERGIRWNDPSLNIDWGIESPIISAKDNEAPFFADLIG